tara:strand:+ start:1228 stop:1926 length:699 start_codon:yes stop_codon:yes gene_type:complete
MTTEQDILNKIQNLKWYPFIGKEYENGVSGKKVLLVGESHYHENNEQSIAKHNKPEFTKIVVNELAIQRMYWSTKMFSNLHRTLIGNDTFDSEKLWNSLSFYNFVQRAMITNKGRPTETDLFSGWEVFFKMAEILKPDICIFIGTGSSNYLKEYVNKNRTDINITEFKWLKKISRTYPRKAKLELNKRDIELHFIQHTSQYFSWSKWHEHLKKELPTELNYWKEITNRNKKL